MSCFRILNIAEKVWNKNWNSCKFMFLGKTAKRRRYAPIKMQKQFLDTIDSSKISCCGLAPDGVLDLDSSVL